MQEVDFNRETQLFQSQLPVATLVTAISAAEFEHVTITSIWVSATEAATISIFQDNASTPTFGVNECLVRAAPVNVGAGLHYSAGHFGSLMKLKPNSHLGLQASVAGAVTVTIYGVVTRPEDKSG